MFPTQKKIEIKNVLQIMHKGREDCSENRFTQITQYLNSRCNNTRLVLASANKKYYPCLTIRGISKVKAYQ